MTEPRDKRVTLLRRLGWGSPATAVLIAVVIVSSNRGQRRAVLDQVREQQRLRLRAAKHDIENYMGEIELCLRLISLDPHVVNMARDSYDYIQTICEANYARHRPAEIYVIERDLDVTRRPLMTFEKGDAEHDVEELHSLERAAVEYATQVVYSRRSVEGRSLETLSSEPA